MSAIRENIPFAIFKSPSSSTSDLSPAIHRTSIGTFWADGSSAYERDAKGNQAMRHPPALSASVVSMQGR
jgi:hypothetical protein